MRIAQSMAAQVKRPIALAVAALATVALALFASTAPAHAEFGIATFDQQLLNAGGGTYLQAGGHPYEITTTVNVNSHPDPEFFNEPMPDADPKDVLVDLPPGLFGNTVGISQCTTAELAGANNPESTLPPPECPVSSIVGTIKLATDLNFLFGASGSLTYPLFNMAPPSNMPAEFGFNIGGVSILLAGNVRTGGDLGVTVGSTNIPVSIPLSGITTTFWGTPSDPSHDRFRCDQGQGGYSKANGGSCEGQPGTPQGPNPDPVSPKAFLTVPVSCTAPGTGFPTTVRVDSWLDAGAFDEQTLLSHLTPGYPAAPGEWGAQQGLIGCERVPFNPSVSVEPTNHQADTPTGVNIDFKLPQEGLLNPEGIATSDVKKTVVTLPAGISVSPSAAAGLGACSLEEIGLHNGDKPTCPDSSKLGTVEIDTPLLPDTMMGSIYLAKQNENPFGSLLAIYLVAEGNGVAIKLAGQIELDPTTGRLTTTVNNSPQLPFNEFRVDFKGGPRSPLVNPHSCGTYTTNAMMTPWSGNPPADISSSFEITSGPGGGPCPNPQQFAPGFAIGTTNNQAGAFSPLSLTMTRADGDQQLGGISMHTPTGLLGTLSSVALCPEPQAAQGTCGESSQIGTITAASGAGPNPFYVTGGKLYITGPYKGAPFGLSAVVPAKAGPLDLGTVVVRGSISIDPHTAALTIETDPLPTILQGIPLDLRLVNVSVDRPGFIFNPTDCDPLSIAGTLTGGQGLVEPVRSSFQVTNCARLGFAPKFEVKTNGHTSRIDGASLTAKLVYPRGSMGTQANIAKVKVSLPRQLPSRLSTLQKACPAETFEANPAACPQASRIGSAIAHTQVLPVPISGPVYFVSHGGEAFPDLVAVLQGYNVTIDLVGNTFISKKGITSTTFQQVPDVPVESFELTLPQGPSSALGANANLCKSKLIMPTTFVAQDGVTLKQATKIKATGCPKAKARAKHRRKKHHKRGHH